MCTVNDKVQYAIISKCILQNIVDKQLSTAAEKVVVSIQLKVTETTGSSECRKSRHSTEARQHLIGTMKNQVRNHKINCNDYCLIPNHVKGNVEWPTYCGLRQSSR